MKTEFLPVYEEGSIISLRCNITEMYQEAAEFTEKPQKHKNLKLKCTVKMKVWQTPTM